MIVLNNSFIVNCIFKIHKLKVILTIIHVINEDMNYLIIGLMLLRNLGFLNDVNINNTSLYYNTNVVD